MTASDGVTNLAWASLIIEELYRCGVTYCCISPGARNAPLTVAATRHADMRCTLHVDERGSAFHALGWGVATGTPALWITTTGTAAANGLPAVIEASRADIPLLMMTADRPPELRGTTANQAIDQVALFGRYPRAFMDLPCPERGFDAHALLRLVDEAFRAASGRSSGPVHVNVMFREPLLPAPDAACALNTLALPESWGAGRTFVDLGSPLADVVRLDEALVTRLGEARRPLLVIGRLDSEEARQAAAALAVQLQWPVFADITSGLRQRGSAPFVPYYDLILAAMDGDLARMPDTVLHIGGTVTSKRLLTFLAEAAPDVYVRVVAHDRAQDPSQCYTRVVRAPVTAFCSCPAVAGIAACPHADWVGRWQRESAACAAVLDEQCGGEGSLDEPGVARLVSRLTPAEWGIFLGNSMPVRDMDTFGAVRGNAVAMTANRGASGIDGCIATASGWACGRGRGVTAVLGDLAALHDLNSLAYLRGVGCPVVLIVINNNGGGVFSFLPLNAHQDVFEACFGAPHGICFEHAAQLYGIAYARPEGVAAFTDAYRAALASGASAVIEVCTDREANVVRHTEIHDAVRRALPGAT